MAIVQGHDLAGTGKEIVSRTGLDLSTKGRAREEKKKEAEDKRKAAEKDMKNQNKELQKQVTNLNKQLEKRNAGGGDAPLVAEPKSKRSRSQALKRSEPQAIITGNSAVSPPGIICAVLECDEIAEGTITAGCGHPFCSMHGPLCSNHVGHPLKNRGGKVCDSGIDLTVVGVSEEEIVHASKEINTIENEGLSLLLHSKVSMYCNIYFLKSIILTIIITLGSEASVYLSNPLTMEPGTGPDSVETLVASPFNLSHRHVTSRPEEIDNYIADKGTLYCCLLFLYLIEILNYSYVFHHQILKIARWIYLSSRILT